jgi:hypothetical protein
MPGGAKPIVESEASPREDGLHPAIRRLVGLAPRIRTKVAFDLTADGARVEGVTKPGYAPQKRFVADLGESPPTWASNDEMFWRPVMAVLFDRRSDEQAIAQYLRPAAAPDPARRTDPPRPAPREPERKAAPVSRGSRARDWQAAALFVLGLGAVVAAYGAFVHSTRAPEPQVAKAPEPVAKAPEPQIAKAPEPEVAKAPEPQFAPTPAPQPLAPDVPKVTKAALLPGAKAQTARRDAPADGCYRQGDIVTALGTVAGSSDAWVFTTAKPLCVHDAAARAPKMISQLQIVGTPPTAGVSLALSGELLANHRIRVGRGRSRP